MGNCCVSKTNSEDLRAKSMSAPKMEKRQNQTLDESTRPSI